MLSVLWKFLYIKYFYYIYKWVVHRYTGKCEIERILESSLIFPRKVCAIENQCARSKNREMNQLVDNFHKSAHRNPTVSTIRNTDKYYDPDLAVIVIQRTKKLSVIIIDQLKVYIKASCKYQNGIRVIEKLRGQSFDDNNTEHTYLLQTLWNNLGLPESEYSRRSRSWQLLGFQGTDPS